MGKRVLCFSFGSGAVASMFTLTGRDCSGSSTAGDHQQQYSWSNAPCSLQSMADQVRQAVCGEGFLLVLGQARVWVSQLSVCCILRAAVFDSCTAGSFAAPGCAAAEECGRL